MAKKKVFSAKEKTALKSLLKDIDKDDIILFEDFERT